MIKSLNHYCAICRVLHWSTATLCALSEFTLCRPFPYMLQNNLCWVKLLPLFFVSLLLTSSQLHEGESSYKRNILRFLLFQRRSSEFSYPCLLQWIHKMYEGEISALISNTIIGVYYLSSMFGNRASSSLSSVFPFKNHIVIVTM